MSQPEEGASADEVTRAFLAAALPKLPEAIVQTILADGHARAAVGLPAGDYVRLFGERVERHELLRCLRDVANDRPTSLASHDGALKIERFTLDDDGAATLEIPTGAARFANVGLLSEDAARRSATFRTLACAELPPDREEHWRGAIGMGALDDELFCALEMVLDQSPEAMFRGLPAQASEGMSFEELVPDEVNHFSGLLGVMPPPATLTTYRQKWTDGSLSLDDGRLLRSISLSAPLAALRGDLIGQAAQRLSRHERLALCTNLANCSDPFSKLAALQVAIASIADADFRVVGESALRHLANRDSAPMRRSAELLSSMYILTRAITGRRRTLVEWPTYARRIACFLHASHLARVFCNQPLDIENMVRRAGPTARLVELIEAREAPFGLTTPLTFHHVTAFALARLEQTVGLTEGVEIPEEWATTVNEAVSKAAQAFDGILVIAPSPFDPFEAEGVKLVPLTQESFEAIVGRMHLGGEPERQLSDIFNLALVFEPEGDHRDTLVKRIPDFIQTTSDDEFPALVELGLQLAARWRLPDMSERLMAAAIERFNDTAMDPSAPPRLSLLGAASSTEVADWVRRAGDYAANWAFAMKSGFAIENMLGAIDIISDVDPRLEGTLIRARSFALLARNRSLTISPAPAQPAQAGPSPDETVQSPAEQAAKSKTRTARSRKPTRKGETPKKRKRPKKFYFKPTDFAFVTHSIAARCKPRSVNVDVFILQLRNPRLKHLQPMASPVAFHRVATGCFSSPPRRSSTPRGKPPSRIASRKLWRSE